MKRSTCYLAVLAATTLTGATWAEPATNQMEKPLRLELTLVDGSRIIGTPAIETVPVATSFALMNIPLKQIQTLKIGEDHETVSLELRNGDKLKGVITLAPIKLTTVFGSVAVGIAQIRELRVVPPGCVGFAPSLTIVSEMEAAVAKNKGRAIWQAVVLANAEREPLNMPPAWPTTGFATSTDYFKYLMGWTMNGLRPTAYTPDTTPICENFTPSVLAGPNIPPASDPRAFGATNNAWCVVATDEKDQVPNETPFLFSRNIEVTVQDGKVRLRLNDEIPARTTYGVIITRDGSVMHKKQTELDEYAGTLNPVLLRHVRRP